MTIKTIVRSGRNMIPVVLRKNPQILIFSPILLFLIYIARVNQLSGGLVSVETLQTFTNFMGILVMVAAIPWLLIAADYGLSIMQK